MAKVLLTRFSELLDGQDIFSKYYKKTIHNHRELAKVLLDSTQPGWINFLHCDLYSEPANYPLEWM